MFAWALQVFLWFGAGARGQAREKLLCFLINDTPLDARFYRETLAARVRAIALQRDHIHITNEDARTFLVNALLHDRARRRRFAYLDPPYYANGGNRLYQNAYTDRDHQELARSMLRQVSLKWIMSYDDAPFIRTLYRTCHVSQIALRYSLQHKKRAQELVILPPHVRPPDRTGLGRKMP